LPGACPLPLEGKRLFHTSSAIVALCRSAADFLFAKIPCNILERPLAWIAIAATAECLDADHLANRQGQAIGFGMKDFLIRLARIAQDAGGIGGLAPKHTRSRDDVRIRACGERGVVLAYADLAHHAHAATMTASATGIGHEGIFIKYQRIFELQRFGR